MTGPDVYFERLDHRRYRPTGHTGGAWAEDEQHISPMNGLVVHAVERFVIERGLPPDLVIARISLDILGVIRLEDFEIDVEVVRPGRTIELLEAVVSWRGRSVVRARIWRMAPVATAGVEGGAVVPLRPPDRARPFAFATVWPGGFVDTLDLRVLRGPEPGRTTAWVSSPIALIDEPSSALAGFVRLVDTANGIAVRHPPGEWLFPNLDLTVHLHRQPAGPWVGLDTTVVFGPTGQGVTSSVVHDLDGAVGRAEQILTIRPSG